MCVEVKAATFHAVWFIVLDWMASDLCSQVTMVHQEYEEKIKGLMPAELRQELEDTITSLQAQVSADVLERHEICQECEE